MKYCAFLRGINVNGTSMKMAEVCQVFENSGMQNISSVLATGNIIFDSDKNKEELKSIIEQAMSQHFGYDAFLFIKTKEEVVSIFEKKPFEKSENKHIYVFVGVENAENILIEEFENVEKTENEKAKIVEKTFYWQVPKGNTLDSNFGKVLGRKSLKDKITSRNLNTFEKIIKKYNTR